MFSDNLTHLVALALLLTASVLYIVLGHAPVEYVVTSVLPLAGSMMGYKLGGSNATTNTTQP